MFSKYVYKEKHCMKILSPVLKDHATDDRWWRSPIIDQKVPVTGEASSETMAEHSEDYPESGNVVQLWPKPISLNSLCDTTSYSDDDNWAS